jgi:CheY-like chemotaxis protein
VRGIDYMLYKPGSITVASSRTSACNAIIRRVLRVHLEAEDLQVSEAKNRAQRVRKTLELMPSLIILDLRMHHCRTRKTWTREGTKLCSGNMQIIGSRRLSRTS